MVKEFLAQLFRQDNLLRRNHKVVLFFSKEKDNKLRVAVITDLCYSVDITASVARVLNYEWSKDNRIVYKPFACDDPESLPEHEIARKLSIAIDGLYGNNMFYTEVIFND